MQHALCAIDEDLFPILRKFGCNEELIDQLYYEPKEVKQLAVKHIVGSADRHYSHHLEERSDAI